MHNIGDMSFTRDLILKSFFWKFFEKCSVQIVTFVITIILARILRPEDYGLVAIMMIFINLLNVVVDGGFSTALIQKKDADELDFSTVLYGSLSIALVLYVLLFLVSSKIAVFYGEPEIAKMIKILGLIIFPSSINAVQKAYVSKFMFFNKMFYCSLASVIVSGVIGIVLALKSYGVWALLWQSILNQVIITILLFVILQWKPILSFSLFRFKRLFDYGWKIFLSNFIIAIYEDIRGLFIGKVYQPEVLAYFERGKQFPSLIMANINTSVQTILFPTFADVQDDLLKVKNMMRTATQITCFFVFPLLIFLFVVADSLVLVLLGEKWIQTVPFVRIFSIALILMPIQSSNMIAIKSLGYSNIILKIEIFKKIIETIILIFTFQYNVYYVALGIVLYNFICIFINLSPNRKLLNYTIANQIKDILPSFLISLSMGGLISVLNFILSPSLFLLILQTISALIIYFIINKYLKVSSYLQIISILKSLKRT